MLEKNDFIDLHCTVCNYKYKSNNKLKTYTTKNIHDLFFEECSTRNLYSKENTKINLDFNYYLSDYYLINEDYENEDYENIMLIGSDKEIIDFFKNFYEKEKLKNKNLNELNKKNEIKILELNLKIF